MSYTRMGNKWQYNCWQERLAIATLTTADVFYI